MCAMSRGAGEVVAGMRSGQTRSPARAVGSPRNGAFGTTRAIPQHAHSAHPGRQEAVPPCSPEHCSPQAARNEIAPVVCPILITSRVLIRTLATAADL